MTPVAEPKSATAADAADPTAAVMEEPAAPAAKETVTTAAPATEAVAAAAVPAETGAPTTAPPPPAAASAPPPSAPQNAPAENSTAAASASASASASAAATAAAAAPSASPEAPPPAAAPAVAPVAPVATEKKPDHEKAQKPAEAVPALQKPGKDGIDEINPRDFSGEVQSNNDLPSAATLRKLENYTVLDRHGKTHTFRSLYAGRNVARRVLIIFVRHFFCGNCQEYLRTLSASITPEALLRLPISTFIAVVGCGDPGLIDMYLRETGCPFPVYADPTRRLYDELGMVRTLALGQRPAYMRKSLLLSALSSVAQGLRQVPSGKATKAGDHRQIGGEFLFEPLTVQTPAPVEDDLERRIGEHQLHGSSITRQTIGEGLSIKEEPGAVAAKKESSDATATAAPAPAAATPPTPPTETTTTTAPPAAAPTETMTSPNGAAATSTTKETNGSTPRVSSVSGNRPTVHPVQHDGADEEEGYVEEKQVTWCHRMRTTRDHAEIPELMEVLGLDGQGVPIKDNKRWSRALQTRKGTGLSMASQMSALSSSRGSASIKSFDAATPVVSGKA
ncbi:hypothetical protein MAPG_05532 [Magnaporthiopsis poae ATCC 64411]|uniref:Thioredoxin-like fold domain-containing protein n=1 Tax=Magnaporthiopsis poae (strain ATCC 64411 / 73-15) TaxID=644358 RepID=A0A0C4DZM7_MAGP6|nr:hypothetical protein MAPG_05532 [Magnaporthiopsis poae ATCC 64411]